jgi:hypothetical protein
MRRQVPSKVSISSRAVRAWRTPLLISSVTNRLTVSPNADKPHSASVDNATRRASAALAAKAGSFVRDSILGVYPDLRGLTRLCPSSPVDRSGERQGRDHGKETVHGVRG